ncbi:probable glycosyltransferase At5g20260 at C-terminar half [Coccomyxa sp. Obi]|nr:probable glycosyltransferase At5g20260 at C-terminar half [Coccomyxa sp. Obi]
MRPTWSFLRLFTAGALLGLASCTTLRDQHQTRGARVYQDELILSTASLRPGAHTWAGYSGPWIENVFFHNWLLRKPQVSRIYLPIAWTDCLHKGVYRDEMQQVLNSLDPAYRYFSVMQLDRGLNHQDLRLLVPSGLDVLFFSAGGETSPLNAIPIPLLKNSLEPSGHAKTISVSLQGSITHDVRKLLHDDFADKYLFLGVSENWKIISESSNFSFCPRGFGSTSFRLYETLQLGTIPIYVWEDDLWLPFQDIIDWNEFAIVVELKDRHLIPSKIAQADVERMTAAVKQHRGMFTYNFTVDYIFQRLLNEDNSMVAPI